MPNDTELSVEQTAAWARVSPQTVRRWIRNGDLKANRQGRDYSIPVASLAVFTDNHTVSASATTTGSQ